MAFPTHFPDGNDGCISTRKNKIDFKEYCQYILLHNSRFATHPRLTYFLCNAMQRQQTINNAKFLISKNKLKDFTLEELADKIKNQPQFVESISACNQQIRGSSAYWQSLSSKVLAMVENIGSPHVFFTLSAADLFFWLEIFKSIDPQLDLDAISA